MADDGELLRRYADEGSEEAFAELVHRHLDVVYGAALRQVHDAHLAEDIVQSVFAGLARQASSLARRPVLLGWLYTAVHYTSANARRDEWRRASREREAAMMTDNAHGLVESSDWERMKPVLDAAMHDLGERDREALLLRFFRGLTFAELARPLCLSEDGARKRVDRALERLRGSLARRGITSTAAALTTALSAQPASVLPSGLALSITAGAVSGLAGHTSLAVSLVMTSTQKTLVAAILVLGLTAGMYETRVLARQQQEISSLESSIADTVRSESQVRRERDQLMREQAVSAARNGTIPSAPVAPPAESEPVSAMGGRLPILSFGGSNGMTVAASMVQAFALTPAEQQALQAAVAKAESGVAQLAVAHASIADDPAGGVVITVAPFSEGAEVQEGLKRTFAVVLGPERHSVFLAHYSGASLQQVSGGFGETVRTIRVTRVEPNPNGGRTAAGPFRFRAMVRDTDGAPVGGGGTANNLGEFSGPVGELVRAYADRINAMP